MTRYEIAKRLGVTTQAVYSWYTGKSLPNHVHLFALAKLLNQDPKAILNEFLKKRKARK